MLEILYCELIKRFKLEDGKLYRLLKNGNWKVVEIKDNSGNGYCRINWNGRIFKAHRIMYSLFHQCDVDSNLFIDHIDGDRLNNSHDNLRLVSNRENQSNRTSHRKGSLVGASFNKGFNKWMARIKIHDKLIYLGLFDTELEAHNTYLKTLTMLNEGATAEQIQDTFDVKTKEKCTSKYKGVYWFKRGKMWRAYIKINGKMIHIGCYPTEEEANRVYLKARELINQFVDNKQFRKLLLKG